MPVKVYKLKLSLGSIELPSNSIKFSGSKAMIMNNPDSKPIIKVSNCPGKASAFLSTSSLTPERFILSDEISKIALVITKVIAQIPC